jgi:hypothetical protein
MADDFKMTELRPLLEAWQAGEVGEDFAPLLEVGANAYSPRRDPYS